MGNIRLLFWHRRFAHNAAVFWALLVVTSTLEVYDEPQGHADYWDYDPKPDPLNQEDVSLKRDVLLERLLTMLQQQRSTKQNTNDHEPQWNLVEGIPADLSSNGIEKRKLPQASRRSDLMLRLQRYYNVNKQKHLRRLSQVCLFKLCPSGYAKRYF